MESMYGIFTYIYHKFMVDVGKYTIHGSYGLGVFNHHWHVPLFQSTRPSHFFQDRGAICHGESRLKIRQWQRRPFEPKETFMVFFSAPGPNMAFSIGRLPTSNSCTFMKSWNVEILVISNSPKQHLCWWCYLVPWIRHEILAFASKSLSSTCIVLGPTWTTKKTWRKNILISIILVV